MIIDAIKNLHMQWPAGKVEKLPVIAQHGETNIPGIFIVGDLAGVPLLKFSAQSGTRAITAIMNGKRFTKSTRSDILDVAIIGAGVSGLASAMTAKKQGLSYAIYEATEPFSTIVNFPKGKPIYTYPKEMKPDGDIQFTAQIKETLVDELNKYLNNSGVNITKCHVKHIKRHRGYFELICDGKTKQFTNHIIIAIGRSGNHRTLGCEGETLDKVYNRLFDPKEHADKKVAVVGGGDSALETAIALTTCGAHVTMIYRGDTFNRPKPDNIAKVNLLKTSPDADTGVLTPTSARVNTAMSKHLSGKHNTGSLRVLFNTTLNRVTDSHITAIDKDKIETSIENDIVFTMLGREAPLDFFRKSKIKVHGDWRPATLMSFITFFSFCIFMYYWKGSTVVNAAFKDRGWFPFNMPDLLQSFGGTIAQMGQDPSTLVGTLSITLTEPGFYYSIAYCLCVVCFGFTRIKRRNTPYVTKQTFTLMGFQVIPLFLLPYIILPYLGHNGYFDSGLGATIADNLFPSVSSGHSREYWRSFGFVLAWPLFIWNFFTSQPMMWWLIIGCIQTFVIIPLLVFKWGKGAYCGWICSCGALAETLGDKHRTKMPHGPISNKLNYIGQIFLLIAMILFALRIIGWIIPKTNIGSMFANVGNAITNSFYYPVVDIWFAGIIGVGCYFWFSGRVWCRFACPLAALMHIYARFSQYRIFAKKEKCISCNVCTSVCHQGIDIMNFANKGLPMIDPQCVRCSACVQECPTGVLTFGRINNTGKTVYDKTPARND